MNSSKNGKIDNQTLGNLLANNNQNAVKTAENHFQSLLLEQSLKDEMPRQYVVQNDATRVDKPELELLKNRAEKDWVPPKDTTKNLDGKTAYLEIYKDYVPQDKEKYQIVANYIKEKGFL